MKLENRNTLKQRENSDDDVLDRVHIKMCCYQWVGERVAYEQDEEKLESAV